MVFRKHSTVAGQPTAKPVTPQQQQTGNDPPLPKQVEDVMFQLTHGGWDFITHHDFNPVTLALELLDDATTQSRQLSDFERLMGQLELAMDVIVNQHYQAFNYSTETFARVVDGIADSQQRVRQLRCDLERCKLLLQCKRPDLLELWVKSVQYKEMLRMLETIEGMKAAPERIEQCTFRH
jgi:exocyst complex component 4